MDVGKFEAGAGGASTFPWPLAARVAASLALLVHFGAVLTSELRAFPASPLEQWAAMAWQPYASAMNLDHAHRFYVIPQSPTPVVTAKLRFADGRPGRVVRLPDRSTWPRIRYQRQLALAYHLHVAASSAREAGATESVLAPSYARHLCRSNPGCVEVTLSSRLHLFPSLSRLREAAEPGASPLDLDGEESFSTPEQIGVFACDEP